MHAAVITAFDAPPVYGEHPEPVAQGEHEMVVDVLAAGLHHLTRAKADGSHYSATGVFPLVPGVDGVVRDSSGRVRYAALDDTNLGTFAERTVIDTRRSVVLPDDVDPVRIAAAMNPGMSSWVALRRRVTFREGQRVLILGATGSAGRMAVQIAKRFGAAQVFAVGRDATRLKALPDLGADPGARLRRNRRSSRRRRRPRLRVGRPRRRRHACDAYRPCRPLCPADLGPDRLHGGRVRPDTFRGAACGTVEDRGQRHRLGPCP